MKQVEKESEVTSLVLVQQEKDSFTGLLPGLDVSDSKHVQHQGTLNGALRIIAHDFLVVHLDARGCDWVSVPVMLLLFVTFC